MTTTSEKISVIIPIYNAQDTLEQTVQSVLKQKDDSAFELEVILVNDGSKDQSLAICRKLAENELGIQVLDKSNGGVSSARNCGMAHATGDYIVFVDSDDLLLDGSLERLYNEICASGADLVCAGYEVLQCGIRERGFLPDRKMITGTAKICKTFGELEIGCSTLAGAPWGKMFRRSLVSQGALQFPEDTCFGEDFCFCADYYRLCKAVSFIPEAIYLYNMREGSLVNSYSDKSAQMFEILHKRKSAYYEQLPETLRYINTMYVEQMIACISRLVGEAHTGEDVICKISHLVRKEHFRQVIQNKDYECRSIYVKLMTSLSLKGYVGLIYLLTKIKVRIRK